MYAFWLMGGVILVCAPLAILYLAWSGQRSRGWLLGLFLLSLPLAYLGVTLLEAFYRFVT